MVIEIYFYKDIVQIYMIISDLQMAHKKNFIFNVAFFEKSHVRQYANLHFLGQFLP